MNPLECVTFASRVSFLRQAAVFLLLLSTLALAGCGSTKVYNISKTVVYNGSTYNLGNVQTISSRIEGTLPSGEKLKLQGMDKKSFNALLDQNKSIQVTSFVQLDEKEFVYRNSKVNSYAAFAKIEKSQQSAMSSINKFMADKKKTQLKLK